MRQQPCSSHSRSWLVCAWQKLKHGMHPFSSTHLDFYYLNWTLQGFPHVLNVIREPCWYLHTAILCITHPPIGWMLHWLIYSSGLEVSGRWYWKSQSKGNNAGYICHGKQGEWVCWAYLGYWGSSDGGGIQDLTWEQLVRESTPSVKGTLTQTGASCQSKHWATV
jgi:hypothetical protein